MEKCFTAVRMIKGCNSVMFFDCKIADGCRNELQVCHIYIYMLVHMYKCDLCREKKQLSFIELAYFMVFICV